MFSFSHKNLISSGHEQKAPKKLEHNQKIQDMNEQIFKEGTMTTKEQQGHHNSTKINLSS